MSRLIETSRGRVSVTRRAAAVIVTLTLSALGGAATATTAEAAATPANPAFSLDQYSASQALGSYLVDVDHDGDLDIVADRYGSGFYVLKNNGSGVFTTTPYSYSSARFGLGVGDVNEDGNIDVVLTGGQVFFGAANGTFTAGTANALERSDYGLVLGDFDGDGHLDLATATYTTVYVHLGDGTGSFGPQQIFATSSTNPYIPRAADINKDGRADIVLGGHGDQRTEILLSTGTGLAFTSLSYTTGGRMGVSIADMNADTYLDIAYSGLNVGMLLFDPATQSFTNRVLANTGDYDSGVAAADFNGDGYVDLAANVNSSEAIFLADGAGGYVLSTTTFAVMGYTQNAGDLNGDGKIDIVVNAYASTIDVHLNNPGAAPSVTTQPADTATVTGGTATFTAAASGTPTPTVQWQSAPSGSSTFTDIVNATNTTLTLTAVTATQNGSQYRAVFTNATTPAATSTPATLTVNEAPAVTTQPADTTHNAGETATFTAAASGLPAPTVQWQSSPDGSTWTDISGAIDTTLTLTNVTHAQNGVRYHAVFTNSTDPQAITTAATLIVNPAPSATDPTDVAVLDRGSATFTASGTAAAGTPDPTVQWQISTDDGVSYTKIPGATTDTLTLPNVYMSDNNNRYRAVYTNTAGATPTAAARLTVVANTTTPGAPGGETSAPGVSTTIHVATTPLLGGGAATISGTTKAFATVDLYGYTRPDTTYDKLARTTADASGKYRFTTTVTANSRFRVRVNGLNSSSVAENVRSTVTLTATKTGTRTYVFTGTVAPHRAGQLVTVYYRTVTGTRAAGTARTNANGRYRITYTFTAYGKHTYTAYARVGSDTLTSGNISTNRSISVYRAR
ncbi:MAG: hypothetical protein JWM93_1264 [Frankiales bacterium]|nr:hypothetical protein [Frankiales bacterium]